MRNLFRGAVLFLALAMLISAPLPVCGPVSLSPVVQAAAREPVRGKHGMVASQSELASAIGVDVMRRGGNAIDAAVAVALAMAVTYPEAGNLGGGGFMLMRFQDGRATAIDYREKAPAAATRNIYVNDKGELIRGEGSSTSGYRAAGVPGTVAGLALALQKYGSGKFKWAQLVAPAQQLAVKGFVVSHRIAGTFRNAEKEMAPYQDSQKIFLNNGKYLQEGDILRQPELAATLQRLQKQGPREFYEGRTAQLIAADMKRHNGLMTLEDLQKYQPTERVPLRGTYRGHEVISMPPPSSGGIALLEMLNILETYDLNGMSWSSSERYHILAEAMRRAFADRSSYLGDADFVKVPVAGLIAKDYAASLRTTISPNRASRSQDVRAGNPPGREGMDTTHFTVVDGDGNCVTNTYTINDLYGSGVTAEGTGVLLNDEMDDFAARPGTPNAYGLVQGENNAVAGGKRPLSSMTPTIVLRRDGSLWFATGARGGPRIINAVLQVVVNVIDHNMNIQQALDAPRIHHQWLPDELVQEPYGLSLDTYKALLERGHRFAEKQQYVAQTTGIMIEEGTGVRLGAVDSRGDGAAVGY